MSISPTFWDVLPQTSSISEGVSVNFIPTAKFLGDHHLSYGQNLTFSFRVDRRDSRMSAEDVVLEGAGLRVAVPLIAQGNAYPNENPQTYVLRY